MVESSSESRVPLVPLNVRPVVVLSILLSENFFVQIILQSILFFLFFFFTKMCVYKVRGTQSCQVHVLSITRLLDRKDESEFKLH